MRYTILDASTGQPTPAMICITDAADGAVRLPPDGRVNPAPMLVTEFLRGIDYQTGRGWVGPVRKTLGKGDNSDRSFVYESRPSLPHWAEPVMFQVPGQFDIRLPSGRWRIAVSLGIEYVPVVEHFETTGKPIDRQIRLVRWINLPAEGWYSGDVHVHHPTTGAAHRQYLLQFARAVDLHLVNILEQIHHGGRHSEQWGYGPPFRVEHDGRWLITGQEAPTSRFGHIIGLNVNRLVHEPAHTELYDLAFNQIHDSPEALVGYAHFAWMNNPGFTWVVTTKGLDFLEVLQFSKLNALGFHDYLNLGFRLAAAAGSDVPWGSTMGEVRTFVHTGDRFDPDRWFASLKAGRSFVSNGPALELTVDGEGLGATIERRQGETINVRARVRGHEKIGLPIALRVVGNDGFIHEARGDADQAELVAEFDLEIPESRWLAAWAECDNGAVAHTSPIYVVVDGRPTWSRLRAPAIIDRQLRVIDQMEARYQGPQQTAVLERLARARAYYVQLRESIGH